MALLGLLAALPARLEAQCTLSGSPASFEPNPPGVSRPITLGGGFTSNLALYQNGASGPYRLLMQESFGYSILDLSNPVKPTALYYHDVRYPVGGLNSVTQHGDGQSEIQTIAVSPDGQRAAFSTTGPAKPFQTVVGSHDGGSGFTLWGDFYPDSALGTLIQHIGSRYITYDIHGSLVSASDVTALPTGSLQVDNLADTTEITTWSGGYLPFLAGNYILYFGGNGIEVIDASSPGPIKRITAAYPQTTITSADFGGRTIYSYAAAVDPADATKLWVLVELSAQAGENSPSYGLLYVTSSLAKVSAGPIWRVPSQSGDVWYPNPGVASALIAGNGDLFVLMWAQRNSPTRLFELYSTTVAAWGAVNSSARPGVFDIPTAIYGNFSAAQPMRGFAAATGNSVYAYLPTGSSAYVIPMSCNSVNSPAVASMTVASQAGLLNNGDTVFVGDQITITPTVNPSPATQGLTGFGWNFDFDFHALSAVEDNGVGFSPRIKNRDNDQFGNPTNPPGQVTLIGPCDPRNGGGPNSGAGCWNSVLTNSAVGGPDFTGAERPTDPAKPLTFAFEANNALGSGGASLFTLKWKVPAAKIQSTQILSRGSLVSASDGNPTGYLWSFGPDAQHLTASCTTSACAPPSPFNTKGVYTYSLTAKYFIDQAFATTTTGTYTVTDFVPAFSVNGSANGPVTAVTNLALNVVNSSQRGASVTANGGYSYSFCKLPCADNYVAWGAMNDAGPSGSPTTSATIPTPATAGTYALKVQVNYQNPSGTAFWPDSSGTTSFTVNLVNVVPLVVTASVSPASAPVNQLVTFSCDATGGVTPYSYQWRSPLSFVIPGATQPTYRTTSTAAGNVQAYCFVTDNSAPTPQQSSATAVATFTGGGGPPPGGNVSVNVSVSPNPATVNQTVTFTCSASGGTSPYTYQWRSGSFNIPGATQPIYQTSSSTPTSINAGCTATDSAGAQGSDSATVTINDVPAPPAPCTGTVNFAILDRDNGFISIPLSSALGIQYFAVETGQNLVFQASGTGIYSADWTFGDGGSGSGNPIWYTYTTAGTFTATVRANSNATCSRSYRFIVAAPSGLFTARYADNSLFVATNVESGKDLSFVAADSANSYAWDFGDGSPTATGKNVTHAFTVHGSTSQSFTTTLTVTIGSQNWSTSQTFTVLPPPEPPKWFVAGMAYLQGSLPGTLWQTDVTVFNPDPTRSGTYSLAFLDGRNPVDPVNLTWKTISLGAQQSISSPNILAFFGQPLGSFGALLVRGDSAPVPPVLTSRTFNSGDPAKGTFGLSVPSTQPSSGLTPQAALAQQFLIGLRDDDTAYTNIGLMNLTTDWSHARLTFLDRSGATNLGQVNVDVPPYGVAQLTRPLVASPPNGVGFQNPLDAFSVRVSVLSGGSVFPYATVIDRRSTDSIVVTASDRPSPAYRMPGIIRLQGANDTVWRSRFYITNPSTTTRKASISYSFIPCDPAGCKGRVTGLQSDVTLLPGETLWADDFPKVWLQGFGFDASDTTAYQASYVDVTPSAGDPNQEPLLVLGQTYNDQPGGPVGLQVPGFTDADTATKTGANKRLLLAGLVSNRSYRTNVALFLQRGASGQCRVHVLSDTGVELAHQDIGFGGTTTFVQLNDAGLFASLPGNKDRLAVVIDSFDGDPISAYATIVDNTSGDATFLKAQPAP